MHSTMLVRSEYVTDWADASNLSRLRTPVREKVPLGHPQREVQLLNLQRGKIVLSVGETSVGQEAVVTT